METNKDIKTEADSIHATAKKHQTSRTQTDYAEAIALLITS
jgi:hypothetical protein